MAYAATQENFESQHIQTATVFQVLYVTVPTLDACRVRKGISACPGAGVLRCEPLLHKHASYPACGTHVRLSIRLRSDCYARVVHALLENSHDGEIGHLASWSEHLSHHAPAVGAARNHLALV